MARKSNKRVIPIKWSWWVTSNNFCGPGEQLIVFANGDDESDHVGWSLLLLAVKVWNFSGFPISTIVCPKPLSSFRSELLTYTIKKRSMMFSSFVSPQSILKFLLLQHQISKQLQWWQSQSFRYWTCSSRAFWYVCLQFKLQVCHMF